MGFTPRALHEAARPPALHPPRKTNMHSPQPPLCCSTICAIDAGRTSKKNRSTRRSAPPYAASHAQRSRTRLPHRDTSACGFGCELEQRGPPCRLIIGDLTSVTTPFHSPATHLPARQFAGPRAVVLPAAAVSGQALISPVRATTTCAPAGRRPDQRQEGALQLYGTWVTGFMPQSASVPPVRP